MLSGLYTRRKQGSLCVSFESLMAERDAEAKNESSPCPPISGAEALPGRGLQAVKWAGSGPALTRIQAYMLHIPTPSETGTHRPPASLPQCPFFAEEYEFFLSLLAPKLSFLEFETIGCHLPTEQIGKLGAGPCSESHKPIVGTVRRKAAGPLCSSRVFALCALGPELAAQQLYLWSLCPANPHQAWKIRGGPLPRLSTHSPDPWAVGRKESPGPSHRAASSAPLCSAHSLPEHLHKKMKTPLSLPHSTGEGTEAQRLKARRTNGQIQG